MYSSTKKVLFILIAMCMRKSLASDVFNLEECKADCEMRHERIISERKKKLKKTYYSPYDDMLHSDCLRGCQEFLEMQELGKKYWSEQAKMEANG
jgi:hypothetical protein